MAEEEGTEEETGTEETGTEETSWRDSIQDEGVRKHAERFESVEALAKGVYDARQKLSKAVIIPGEGATDEDLSSFRKATNVPENPEGYDIFPQEANEEAVKNWQQIFHNQNISKPVAKELLSAVEKAAEAEEQRVAAEELQFATEAENKLKDEWKDDYDANVEFNRRAAKELFGEYFEDAAVMKTADGKLVMDHPVMVRAFARVGREMGEGVLGPVISEGEVQTLVEQANDFRAKAKEASSRGAYGEAKRYDAMEADVLAKIPVR